MPGKIERVGAIEEAKAVRLAPDDLLATGPDAEVADEIDVDVRLAQHVLELESVAGALVEVIEVVEAPVDLLAGELALGLHAGGVVEDAVVDAAIEQKQVRLLDELREVEAIEEVPSLDPLPVDADLGGVALLDELVLVHVGMAYDLHRSEVARELERTELLGGVRRSGSAREHDSHPHHHERASVAAHQHETLLPRVLPARLCSAIVNARYAL